MGPKKLLRSNENKMICGVCGGIRVSILIWILR